MYVTFLGKISSSRNTVAKVASPFAKVTCFIALLVTRARRLLNTIAKVASSVAKVTRFIASLAIRWARSKAKRQDRTQTLIWLVRISFSPVQLFADRGRDGQSAQVANLPRWPIRPHGQSAQMTNLPRWPIRPGGQSARMANPPGWPTCPDGQSGEMANLPR